MATHHHKYVCGAVEVSRGSSGRSTESAWLFEKEVLDAAEAMPEAKFNFSPPESLKIPGSDYKGVRTFASEVKHIAVSNYYLWAPITGDKIPDWKGDDPPEDLRLKRTSSTS